MTESYYRKVIRIKAEDSPNVRFAQAQRRAGIEPTNERIVPGVVTYAQYVKRRKTWDDVRICVGLEAEFYEGGELLLYPPQWLNRAEQLAESYRGGKRKARAIGIDTAEGGDSTAMCAVDDYGIIELVSKKTPDTNIIPREAKEFWRKHGVPPEMVCFDRGGGGKQHVDRLRAEGYDVRAISFGEAFVIEPKKRRTLKNEKLAMFEERYTYANRRAQMYGQLSILLDPSYEGTFGIPAEYTRLRHELAKIPKLYDNKERLFMLPKYSRKANSDEPTLVKLIGHSPDEADALVIAVHVMLGKVVRVVAGVLQ